MIPLMRPTLPKTEDWQKHFQKSVEANQYSNFGPCYHEATQRLDSNWEWLPCSNGTVAVELAARITFEKGSRVAVPDFTCAATINALLRAGMNPVLAPVSEETWHLDVETLWKRRFDFDAICVVNSFGYRLNVLPYEQIANDLDIPLIYDCAGGWGQNFNTMRPVTFSFHATKNFAIGEGGAVRFSSYQQYEPARRLTSFDFDLQRSSWSENGMNGKMDELHCAMICAHLDRQDEMKLRVQQNVRTINDYQEALGSIIKPHELHHFGAPSLCVLGGLNAKKLEAKCEESGLIVKRYYHPLIHEMNGFSRLERIGQSSDFFQSCLALPRDVSDDEFGKVVEFVRLNN